MGRRDRSEVSSLPVKSVCLDYRAGCDGAGAAPAIRRSRVSGRRMSRSSIGNRFGFSRGLNRQNSMAKAIRAVQFLNQFFGGIGGEDKANTPPQLRRGPVGAGRALQAALGQVGVVESTIICGDNYFVDEQERATEMVDQLLRREKPDLVIAGPAFDAGRYGYACANVSVQARMLGIPAVTGMHRDNPGYTTYASQLVCVPTGTTSGDMQDALGRMVRLGLKLARGEKLGPAAGEGYLPTGIRKHTIRSKPAWERAVEMLETRLAGGPWRSEVLAQRYEGVPVRPAARDASKVKLGLVTSGGLVPKHNPDGQVSGFAEKAFRYSIDDLRQLSTSEWESVHGGFNTVFLNTKSPNYVLPLPALRMFEDAGRIKSLHPVFFSTVGNGTSVTNAKRMGAEIAGEFASNGVTAALLVAT